MEHRGIYPSGEAKAKQQNQTKSWSLDPVKREFSFNFVKNN